MTKNVMEWFILIWTSLLVLLITGWILIEFYEWKDTIVGAIIAFIGAIFGGMITYLGVQRTLKHRDRENFLSNATEKLMILEGFIDTYSKYLNQMFFYENLGVDNVTYRDGVHKSVKELYQQLIEDKEKMYKSMDYDAIQIITFHKKTLGRYNVTSEINAKTAKKMIELVRDIYSVFDNSKKKFELEYRIVLNAK